MRIPIRVKDDNSVGALQVETEPSGAGRQQEQEVLRVRVVELLQQVATVLRLRHTVQPDSK